MVEETIRAIRETEGQADAIVQEAQEKSRVILEKAEETAVAERRALLDRAKAEAEQAEQEAREQGKRVKQAAEAATEKEVARLKEEAGKRVAEAENLVISCLI